MSKFMDFYEHVTQDGEAGRRLTALAVKCGEDGNADQEAALDALIAFAEEEGFAFEKDEVKAFLAGMETSGELSDDELDAVAGGKGGCFVIGRGSEKDDACALIGNKEKLKDVRCVIIGVFPDE